MTSYIYSIHAHTHQHTHAGSPHSSVLNSHSERNTLCACVSPWSIRSSGTHTTLIPAACAAATPAGASSNTTQSAGATPNNRAASVITSVYVCVCVYVWVGGCAYVGGCEWVGVGKHHSQQVPHPTTALPRFLCDHKCVRVGGWVCVYGCVWVGGCGQTPQSAGATPNNRAASVIASVCNVWVGGCVRVGGCGCGCGCG